MNTYVFTRVDTEHFRTYFATEDANGVIGDTEHKWEAVERNFLTLDEADAWIKSADPDRGWMAALRVDGRQVKDRITKAREQQNERLSWQLEWERNHEQ